MNKNRYYTLLWLIQFDNMTREDRWVHDKLAAAREFFEKFNENCAQMMIPSEFLAIDEMLYPYRGGTVIKQYNPNKPDKYGHLYGASPIVSFRIRITAMHTVQNPRRSTMILVM